MKTTTPSLRIRGLKGILAAVPAVVGFHPTNSIVLLCVQPTCEGTVRIGPSVRVDVVSPAARSELCRQLADHAKNFADMVVLLVYRRRGGAADLHPLRRACRQVGVTVLDTICVNGSKATSLHTGEQISVPADDDEQVQHLSEILAIHGRRVLPDRESLRASVAFTGDRDCIEALADETADTLARQLTSLDSGFDERELLTDLAVATLADCLGDDDGHLPTAAQAVQLAILICSRPARDELIGIVLAAPDRYLPVLLAALSAVTDELAPDLAVLTAICAYRCGDGALANLALERCLMPEPEHRLGSLIATALASGLPPEFLDQLAQGLRADAVDPETDQPEGHRWQTS